MSGASFLWPRHSRRVLAMNACMRGADLEQDHDQRITRADLLNAMQGMGYDASVERADGILREVDFGRKGEIDFQDYLDVSFCRNTSTALTPDTRSIANIVQIAAGLKELHLESAFTHITQMSGGATRKIAAAQAGEIGERADETSEQRSARRKIPVERSGGGT